MHVVLFLKLSLCKITSTYVRECLKRKETLKGQLCTHECNYKNAITFTDKLLFVILLEFFSLLVELNQSNWYNWYLSCRVYFVICALMFCVWHSWCWDVLHGWHIKAAEHPVLLCAFALNEDRLVACSRVSRQELWKWLLSQVTFTKMELETKVSRVDGKRTVRSSRF